MTQAEINKAVDAIFDKYDKDKSGKLDVNELQSVIQDIFTHIGDPRKISKEDSQKVLNAMDKDKDGTVSKTQLKDIIMRVLAQKK